MKKFSLRADWAKKLLDMTETDKDKSVQSVSAFVLESQNQIRAINEKLQRLLDGKQWPFDTTSLILVYQKFFETSIKGSKYKVQNAKVLSF